MKNSISLIFVFFYITFCPAQETSSIDFIIRNVGINVDGHFNTFTINATFNESNKLESLSGNIQAESIETGIDSRDAHLLKEDYFHTSKFPTITLKSIELQNTSTNNYSAEVSLTVKDKTKKITIPLTVEISESTRKISSEFEINRRDFGVGGRSFVMSNTVKIRVVYIVKLDEDK